jgi:hypothetical protein
MRVASRETMETMLFEMVIGESDVSESRGEEADAGIDNGYRIRR